MTRDKALLVTADNRPVWPFPFVNGQQTDQSRALELDKQAHKTVPFDLSTIEEALL
jgi:hypothetical protein